MRSRLFNYAVFAAFAALLLTQPVLFLFLVFGVLASVAAVLLLPLVLVQRARVDSPAPPPRPAGQPVPLEQVRAHLLALNSPERAWRVREDLGDALTVEWKLDDPDWVVRFRPRGPQETRFPAPRSETAYRLRVRLDADTHTADLREEARTFEWAGPTPVYTGVWEQVRIDAPLLQARTAFHWKPARPIAALVVEALRTRSLAGLHSEQLVQWDPSPWAIKRTVIDALIDCGWSA